MSIVVEPHQLKSVIETFRSAILIAQREKDFPKVLTVDVTADGNGTLTLAGLYGSIIEQLDMSPQVTLVWQPTVEHGWTLIVDGTVTTVNDGTASVTPVSGMLHRPTIHGDGPDWVWPNE